MNCADSECAGYIFSHGGHDLEIWSEEGWRRDCADRLAGQRATLALNTLPSGQPASGLCRLRHCIACCHTCSAGSRWSSIPTTDAITTATTDSSNHAVPTGSLWPHPCLPCCSQHLIAGQESERD